MATANTQTKTGKPAFTADMVRTYLHEIGRVPLLTHEQEIVYGKQVKLMMELYEKKAALAEALGCQPTQQEWAEKVQLSEAELNSLLEQGQRAKEKMIEANLRLVVSV
ncbi:MAG TPA: sigma-70 factor domain-containing protein, partial [Candidatus Caenarcaniphilales bacterium]